MGAICEKRPMCVLVPAGAPCGTADIPATRGGVRQPKEFALALLSAGILMYRWSAGELQLLLVH
ncbi:MAG TPA: hypothetical protein VK391_01470, partial [Allosphingosinicella sp.]|nr:hypothetical protein [Allosphingosinicella sp.]